MKISNKIGNDVVSFLPVEQATGASPIQIWENMRVNKTLILNSSVAIIELPYEPKRKNVHPPMMWLFTAHCSLMSWKPCCWSKTNKCLTTCPHFYNLFTLLQLFHTSTLHLAQLLVTKQLAVKKWAIASWALSILITHKQLLLELSCILGEHSTSFQYQKSYLDLAY